MLAVVSTVIINSTGKLCKPCLHRLLYFQLPCYSQHAKSLSAAVQFCLRKLKDGGEPGKQIGKISFIDLAGSERGAGRHTLLLDGVLTASLYMGLDCPLANHRHSNAVCLPLLS